MADPLWRDAGVSVSCCQLGRSVTSSSTSATAWLRCCASIGPQSIHSRASVSWPSLRPEAFHTSASTPPTPGRAVCPRRSKEASAPGWNCYVVLASAAPTPLPSLPHHRVSVFIYHYVACCPLPANPLGSSTLSPSPSPSPNSSHSRSR
jgi:hypothetical protein